MNDIVSTQISDATCWVEGVGTIIVLDFGFNILFSILFFDHSMHLYSEF